MERLTTKIQDNVYYSKGKYNPATLCVEMETWEVRECMKMLAAYEDTVMIPEDITTMDKNYIDLQKKYQHAKGELEEYQATKLTPEQIGDIKYALEYEKFSIKKIVDGLEELGKYKDLEEQGLLIRLCYKIDDEFFINIQKETYICKISGFFIDKDETKFLVAFQDEDEKTWFEIGETHKKEELFLTKEEAEKELERLNKLEVVNG